MRISTRSSCRRRNVRKGYVAEEDLEAEDDGERKHLLCYLPVELKKPSTSDSTRATGKPACKSQDH